MTAQGQNKVLTTLVLLVGVTCCVLSVDVKKPMKCRGQDVKLTEEDLKAMHACLKHMPQELGDKEEMTMDKLACMGKCIMEKEGLIDEKGMPSKDSMMAKVNTTMPEEVMQELDEAMSKCVDEHGEKVKPDDVTCKSYQELTMCMQMAFMEVCKLREP